MSIFFQSLTKKLPACLFGASLLLSSFSLEAKHDKSHSHSSHHSKNQECATDIGSIIKHNPLYVEISAILAPNVEQFKILTEAVFAAGDQASYQALLDFSRAIAALLPNGRIVVAQQDAGLVIVDTSQQDDPTNVKTQGNSYGHWQTNTVNPSNHNTRLAIFSAQLYPCGIGAETALSATLRMPQAGVAFRMNTDHDNYTQSTGTVRLSQVPVL